MSQFSEYTIVDSIWARSFTNGKTLRTDSTIRSTLFNFNKI